MSTPLSKSLRLGGAIAALMLGATAAFAQGAGGAGGPGGAQPGAGQGGLSPDTQVIAPQPPGASTAPGATPAPGAAPGAGAQTGPKTPLPPRDTPRAQQPNSATAGGDGPKTPLPPRDTPRAQQPGQQPAVAQNADWPCVQVKVGQLSYGQMWGGPPLEAALKSWRDDKDVVEIVDDLVARRTKIEDAQAIIDKFAKTHASEADAKLALLFAGAFDELNTQRSQIVTGIERYARKQRALSEKIKAESLKQASQQQTMAEQNSPEAMQQQQALEWDTRIYDERSQALTYVCESPVILEQRAFDLGRAIQAHLTQSQ